MNLSQLKESVCVANLELVKFGLVTLTWGNAGELTEDGDAFVVKPSGVPYEQITPDDMVLVGLDGKVREGRNRPSSDTPTYVTLFRYFRNAAPQIRGIVHTHSACATAWAQARREIPCFGTTHADQFYGSVPLTRPLSREEVESAYEANTGNVIVEYFERSRRNPTEVPAVLVAGHAPFTWGQTAHDAVKNAVALEAVAQMARDTCMLRSDAPILEEYVLEKHYSRKHGKNAYYGQNEG
ncbi:MAG: L-ribulose-5-phosphate 4-epimerase AraD [Planctomycetia bacterium]|nr:L-ribulose-5-phosphate 4-epimerase AraD [Planctomycetia bacterium]